MKKRKIKEKPQNYNNFLGGLCLKDIASGRMWYCNNGNPTYAKRIKKHKQCCCDDFEAKP